MKGRKEGGRKEREQGWEEKEKQYLSHLSILEGERMAFTSKVFHNFKKTLKGELLIRGSREGKILYIINGKHTKMYLY